LGIKTKDIKIAYNSKQKYLKQKNELLSRLALLDTKPETSDEKLLLFVLYAGHGVTRKARTNIMFNEGRDSDQFEDLEGLLRELTESKKNNYIIALLDCCR
jgi:hypothetical protein